MPIWAPPLAERALAPRDIARAGLCIGCGACAGATGAMTWDGFGQIKPAGPWTKGRSAAFSRICPFSPTARDEDAIAAARFPDAPVHDLQIGRHWRAFVGHVEELGFRAEGSSGGMVTWVAAELLRRGLVDAVAHVAPLSPERDGRFFGYRLSRTETALREGTKSRYYPVTLADVLREIRAQPGRYAVVGVPCFMKAVHLLRAEEPLLRDRIPFTLGLFCGHMKSAHFLESMAWQLGVPIRALASADYRRKDAARPANWYTAQLTLRDGSTRQQDWWHLADGDWGAGFFQNSACNFCDDVVAETADIAFGDAWVEPYSADGRGTNVVIVRAPELLAMIEEAIAQGRLRLEPVDAASVARTQAAGLRQRRDGLAYRLRVMPPALRPRKRVAPGGQHLPLRRKLLYRCRAAISRWSHLVFALARRLRCPPLYLGWARLVATVYEGLAYRRGWTGRLVTLMDLHRQDDPGF